MRCSPTSPPAGFPALPPTVPQPSSKSASTPRRSFEWPAPPEQRPSERTRAREYPGASPPSDLISPVIQGLDCGNELTNQGIGGQVETANEHTEPFAVRIGLHA